MRKLVKHYKSSNTDITFFPVMADKDPPSPMQKGIPIA